MHSFPFNTHRGRLDGRPNRSDCNDRTAPVKAESTRVGPWHRAFSRAAEIHDATMNSRKKRTRSGNPEEHPVGRVREHIQVKGQKFWTLFDTGARNTYFVPQVAALLATSDLPSPFAPALGGKV